MWPADSEVSESVLKSWDAEARQISDQVSQFATEVAEHEASLRCSQPGPYCSYLKAVENSLYMLAAAIDEPTAYQRSEDLTALLHPVAKR